jgi:hypothetical protein
MNTKIATILTVITAAIGLGGLTQAQSLASPKPNTQKYTLSGRSLRGINHRTASNDFGRFFSTTNSASTSQNAGNVSKNSQDISSNNATSNIPPYQPSYQPPARIDNQFQLQPNIDQPLASPNSVIFPIPDQSFDPNSGLKVQVQGE